MKPMSRRGSLQSLAGLGAALYLSKPAWSRSDARLFEPGRRLHVTPVHPQILRISVIAQDEWAALDDSALAPAITGAPPAPAAGPLPDRQRPLAFSVQPSGLVIHRGAVRLQELSFRADGGIEFLLPKGPLLGLGQGGPGFDRRGSFQSMVNGADGYQLATHGSRVPIQWLIGTDGWAMFVHQPLGAFDLTGAKGRVVPTAPGAIDIFFVGAEKPAELMRAYAQITGFPEMVPLWSLGYQQSHRTLGPPEEILEEARTFRRKRLPCDAMIYLGTGFCPNGWNTGNGEFAWNRRAFPDPEATIGALHAENFTIALHIVLEGKHLSGQVDDPCTGPPLPSGRLPDGSWPPERKVPCYWPFHKPLADVGVDGWWPDMGDGFDGLSRLARNRMYFEGQQVWEPDRRVYALNRNGFAGMQRFASFLWSGDVESRWQTLATQIRVGINTALSGISYWGTDIGGFVPTEEFTGELFARWFQFAAFTPLFRAHGRDWRMHLPWGWTTGERGVPETKSWHPTAAQLKDGRVEPICRRYLELRYRLLEYLYAAVHAYCTSNTPILAAMWFHHPEDERATACDDQFYCGPGLLVAPVVQAGATERSVYLPNGRWYDFWSEEICPGGGRIVRAVDLATMPLFVPAGTILPLGPVRQYAAEPSDTPLELVVYPGANGEQMLYEDDGHSFDYRRGAYCTTRLQWNDATATLSIVPAGGRRRSAHQAFVIRRVGGGPARTISFAGKALDVAL